MTSNDGVIDGTAVAKGIRATVKAGVAEFVAAHGRAPGLGTLLVGDNPASAAYVRMKHRAGEQVGIAAVERTLPADASQADVERVTRELVDDPAVDGVLVQMPLPAGLDPEPVILSVPPEKDVDGFHPFNLGSVASELPGTPSCTPAGVMTLLDAYGVELAGADAVVIGRSRTVGMPMALLLLHRNATVTVTHLLTKDLAAKTREADVLISAAGAPGLVTADMVKPGAVVIDIGITRTPDGLKGDVDFDEVRKVASLVSPVPGGVGPMTIATLLQTTLRLAWARAGR
ncbi:MAG: Methenyltetrahydrofolate cyclohydrolase [Thermoleophilia bacterium]|jgi:methylenetetrahydrofolate dehydrogenase (NADP+)/methenyltetrahydrofolate cyclohydrolase|nr:Methenyltetrahydrofolate cyclohydrolase [Thermoleophilia bacterium]